MTFMANMRISAIALLGMALCLATCAPGVAAQSEIAIRPHFAGDLHEEQDNELQVLMPGEVQAIAELAKLLPTMALVLRAQMMIALRDQEVVVRPIVGGLLQKGRELKEKASKALAKHRIKVAAALCMLTASAVLYAVWTEQVLITEEQKNAAKYWKDIATWDFDSQGVAKSTWGSEFDSLSVKDMDKAMDIVREALDADLIKGGMTPTGKLPNFTDDIAKPKGKLLLSQAKDKFDGVKGFAGHKLDKFGGSMLSKLSEKPYFVALLMMVVGFFAGEDGFGEHSSDIANSTRGDGQIGTIYYLRKNA